MQPKFKKFNKIPLLISLIFFLASLFSFIFLYKTIKTNNQISEKAREESNQEASRREEIKSLDKSLKTTQQEQALLDTHFIKSSDVVPLLDTIENLAPQVKATAEVTLVDISSDNSSLSVGINTSGTFESLYKFLTLLENSSYQIEIVSMDMQRVSDGDVVENIVEPESVIVPEGVTTPVKTVVTPKKKGLPQWSAVYKIRVLSFLK